MRATYTVYYQYASKGPERVKEFNTREEANAYIRERGFSAFKYFINRSLVPLDYDETQP